MSNLSSNKRIARNTFFLYLRMALVLIISLYTTRVILDVLGVQDYGIYNVIFGLVFLFGVLNTTLSSGINRFFNYEIGKGTKGSVTKIYNVALRIQLILALTILILVEIIGLWYLNNKMVIPENRVYTAQVIFQFSTFSLFLSIIQAPFSAAILAYERMDFYAIVSIIDVFLKLGFVILLQYIPSDKLLTYGGLMAVISIINFCLYYSYCKIKFKELKFTRKYDRASVKSLSSFSGWMMLDPIAYAIRGQGCNMALNSFFGPIINAAYGISNQVANSLDQFTNAISTSFRPQLIQSYSSGNYIRTKKLLYSMSKVNFVLELALCVPLIFEIDYILKIWLGKFPNYTVSFTCFILVIKTINTLNSPITTVMMAIGKIKKYMTVSFITVSSVLPITLLCLYLGAPPVATYITMLSLTIINQIISVYFISKFFTLFNIKDYIYTIILPCILESIILLFSLSLFNIFTTQTLLSVIFMFIISFLIASTSSYYILLDQSEKSMAISFVKKIFRICSK